MLFPTIDFGIFFLFVFFMNWRFAWRSESSRKWFLTAASYFFYGYWDWRFMFLLAFCSLGAYAIGLLLQNAKTDKERKQYITISVVVNLAVLGFFKYFNFFTQSFNELTTSLGLGASVPFLEIVLPVGISFFTFQAMSYVIDVYRGEITASRSAVNVMMYISFFPQLVAGPIVRASHFMPQLDRKPDYDTIDVSRAARLILGGLFKKIVISNYVATLLVDPVFENPAVHSSVDSLFAVYGYAVQIYCDFSAYSDIAIGVALLLGYHFPDNFNHPYRAATIQDFWRRWHISLSTWLRDYLYIPLGGSKNGKPKTYRNLALTMLLGGLWHGAAWNFVFWGALHGGGLAIERYVREKLPPKKETPLWSKALKIFLLFHFVCLTWVYFRAPSFGYATEFLASVAALDFSTELLTPFVIGLIALGLLINFIPREWDLRVQRAFGELPALAQGAIVAATLVALGAMGPDGVAPFIYFQF